MRLTQPQRVFARLWLRGLGEARTYPCTSSITRVARVGSSAPPRRDIGRYMLIYGSRALGEHADAKPERRHDSSAHDVSVWKQAHLASSSTRLFAFAIDPNPPGAVRVTLYASLHLASCQKPRAITTSTMMRSRPLRRFLARRNVPFRGLFWCNLCVSWGQNVDSPRPDLGGRGATNCGLAKKARHGRVHGPFC